MSSPKTLLKAVSAGRTRQVRLLLDLGSSTEEQDDCGQTPLIRAVFVEHDRNRDKIMRMLLKKGACVSRADVVGRSALAWACLYGRDTDVALLLDYADVDLDYNKVDINGQTALFHATSSGNAATVKLMVQALQKYDLSVDMPDYNGVTPFMHATRLGHDVCASILVHNGNARTGFGQPGSTENFTKKEKWAVSSLRERSKVNKSRQRRSQFPPIANNKPIDVDHRNVQRARRYEPRHQLRHRDENSSSDLDSGLSSDDDQSSISSKNQYSVTTPRIHDASNVISSPVLNCLQNIPPCGIPPSILASPTCSTMGCVSSGEESEVDSVASTIIEGKLLARSSGMDLQGMYRCKTDQMTSSFRQHVLPVVESEPLPGQSEPAPEMSETAVSERSEKHRVRKDKEAMKWLHLKKTLRLTGLAKPSLTKSDASCKMAENKMADKVVDKMVDELADTTKQAPSALTKPLTKATAELKKPSALPDIISEKRLNSSKSSPVMPSKQATKKGGNKADSSKNYAEV